MIYKKLFRATRGLNKKKTARSLIFHICLQFKPLQISKASPDVLALLQESPDSIGTTVVRDGGCCGDPCPSVHHQELRVVDGLAKEQRIEALLLFFTLKEATQGENMKEKVCNE